jgi:hypothetical protein
VVSCSSTKSLEIFEVEEKYFIYFYLKYSYHNQLFAVSATASALSCDLEK